MNIKDLNPDGCALLERMIVEYAARDYLRELRELKAHPHDRAVRGKVETLERFFVGTWFEMLVPYDGNWLMKSIRRRVINDDYEVCDR